MDLNELLSAHQEELMRLSISDGAEADSEHFERIARYTQEIRKLRAIQPVEAVAPDTCAPPAIIYGSYAGDCITPPATEANDRSKRPTGRVTEN